MSSKKNAAGDETNASSGTSKSEAKSQSKSKPGAEKKAKPKPKAKTKTKDARKKEAFGPREHKVAQVFYFLIVGWLFVILLGAIWSIGDFIQPTGKFDDFLALPLGVQIAVVGGLLLLLFLFLIAIAILYKKGSKVLLAIMFRRRVKKAQNAQAQNILAKLITGGLLVSILVAAAGIVVALFQVALGNVDWSDTIFVAFSEFTTGNIVLLVGVVGMAFTALALGFVALWNNGYNFFLNRIFLSLDEDED